MATRYERVYSDMKEELENIKDNYGYANLSNAFGHLILKMIFGITEEECFECNTDGSNDNGIDAIYIEENNTIHFFQFKFPDSSKNICKGVSEEEILKLCNGVEAFTGNDDLFNSFSWNSLLKDKRDEFLDAEIYNFKLWVVRYSNKEINENALSKLKAFANQYMRKTGNEINYEFILAQECLKLYENNIKNVWPDFKLFYKKNLSPFSDEKASVTSAYVTLKSIFEVFFPIQDSIFEGNVRYLNLNSRINDGIKSTILKEPQNFHLLNNGITIVCNDCNDNTAKSLLDVRSGTIINGAQTVGTIIKTLKELDSNDLEKYDKSFVFVKIISFSKDENLVNKMVYTLNTQNQMKSSYTIANDLIIKQLQSRINQDTEYFLEVKNNEYNYLKVNDPNFNKLTKNKIDIETFVQVYTAFYNIDGMASLAKNSKASLFNNDNVQKIINELNFEESILAYGVYLKLMDIIKEYRAYRKNHDKKEILTTLNIEENSIDEYRYLNTGNILILFTIGLIYSKMELDPYKNIIPVIKELKTLFKTESNLSNATRIKETFEKCEELVKKFKVKNGIITIPRKVDLF